MNHLNDLSEIKLPCGNSLYISNLISASKRKVIDEKNIKAIISIGDEPMEQVNYHGEDWVITVMPISIIDEANSNIQKYFKDTHRFVKEHVDQGNKVLIHCFAGKIRNMRHDTY